MELKWHQKLWARHFIQECRTGGPKNAYFYMLREFLKQLPFDFVLFAASDDQGLLSESDKETLSFYLIGGA